MKSGLTVREDNYAGVLNALNKLSGTDVLVGIPAGPPREDSPLSNAEIGYLQSTGATVEIDGEIVTLPPRPFLDMGIEDSRDKTTARLKLAAQAALEGNSGMAEQQKTLKRRRAAGLRGIKPLYAHGFLLRAIQYVVRKK